MRFHGWGQPSHEAAASLRSPSPAHEEIMASISSKPKAFLMFVIFGARKAQGRLWKKRREQADLKHGRTGRTPTVNHVRVKKPGHSTPHRSSFLACNCTRWHYQRVPICRATQLMQHSPAFVVPADRAELCALAAASGEDHGLRGSPPGRRSSKLPMHTCG